jgi:hypothetical protein
VKIFKLIERLRQMQAQHGDVDVYATCYYDTVGSVKWNDKQKWVQLEQGYEAPVDIGGKTLAEVFTDEEHDQDPRV